MINVKSEVTININGVVHTLSRDDALKLFRELQQEFGEKIEYNYLVAKWNPINMHQPSWTDNPLNPPWVITC